MAALADIIVKKNDGATNITFTGVVPSAGDKTPAIWRSNSVGAALAHRPELRMQTSLVGAGGARRFQVNFSYPSLFTDSGTSRTSVAQRGNFTLTGVVPSEMPDADINEYIAQGMNLLASPLIVQSLKAAYAPT